MGLAWTSSTIDGIFHAKDNDFAKFFDKEMLSHVKEAYWEAKTFLLGHLKDSQKEAFDLMNQALSRLSIHWWAIHKQWQKQWETLITMMGMGGTNNWPTAPPGNQSGLDNFPRSHDDGVNVIVDPATHTRDLCLQLPAWGW